MVGQRGKASRFEVMMIEDYPMFVLMVTVLAYWATVGLLIIVKRIRHGRGAGVIPHDAFERRLWMLIVPVVLAWMALPIVAGERYLPWIGLPPWAEHVSVVRNIRWAAAALGVACYLLSLCCWLVLGRHWSMAIVPGQTAQLVRAGPYRWVRHPIYSLSVTLMLATVIVVPTAPMAAVASLHLIAMNLKASHEERHLIQNFGPAYEQYCHEVGRFWPRWPTRSPGAIPTDPA